jgi:glycosyltransferase involved in cell wall biosynthesis
LPSEQVEQFRQEKQLPFQFFFFLGTLEPRKNLVTLIHAYAALPANIRQEVHLVLGGGKGWQYDDIFEAIATHRLENEVHTVGYIPTEEVVLWYNAAIALVYPPIFEGFGIPIIEAMACGKPVLASNTSSLPEAAGEVGLLLPPDDVQAWTQALLRAIEDQPWRNEASIQGQAWAKQFTWQRTAQQTLASYECVL